MNSRAIFHPVLLATCLVLASCKAPRAPGAGTAPAAPAAQSKAPAAAPAKDAATNGDRPWMSLLTAPSGFLFRSENAEDPWSFEVEGHAIRTRDDHGRVFADVDGAVIQVVLVARAQFPGDAPLRTYRDNETAYLAHNGARVEASDRCAAVAIPHEEWRAVKPGASSSTYLAFSTGQNILQVVVANEGEATSAEAERKLRSICRSVALKK
jgi:hypothetical protein